MFQDRQIIRTALAVTVLMMSAQARAQTGGRGPAQLRPVRTLAPSVSLTRVADLSTSVRIQGNRPALDADMVAFWGTDVATGVHGIYKTPIDGAGPFVLIVDEQTQVPGLSETFTNLDNPEIRNGVVAFTGGHNLTNSTIKDGIFLGTGGALTIWYEHPDASPNPNPFMPILEPEGLVFRSVGSNSSNFLDWTLPVFMADQGTFLTVGGDAPGGGSIIKMTAVGDLPAFGGGQMAFSALVNHPAGVDGGVYAWDHATQDMQLIANWNTQMPGRAENFERFTHVDTDGQRIVFAGEFGLAGFGGHQGVYVAPVGGAGPPALRRVAELGDIAPGSNLAFGAFGNVVVDGDLLLFSAWLGHPIVPSGQGIYGYRNGQLFKVVATTDLVDGDSFMGFAMNTRSLDGNRLAMRATYQAQWAVDFALYVATIN